MKIPALIAHALFALAAAANAASLPPMASGNFGVPFHVEDGNGNTHSSATFKARSSGPAGVGGVPGLNQATSASFSLYPGYLQRLPTLSSTSTPTPTPSPSITRSPTSTASPTCTPTPTSSRSPSPSSTSSASPTPSSSATPSATSSATLTPSGSTTPTVTESSSATTTAIGTWTNTETPLGTFTNTSSLTVTLTVTATPTASPSASATATPSSSATATRSATPTATTSSSPSSTFSPTASGSATPSLTASVSLTLSASPTQSNSPIATPSETLFVTQTATLTPSATASATPSTTPAPSATATPFLGLPVLAFSLIQDQGDPWFGGTDLRYTFSVTNTAGVAVSDLTLTFESDVNSGNSAMEIGNSPNFTGIEGPASWGPVSFVEPAKGVIMGQIFLGTGQAMGFPTRRILSQVLGQAIGSSITARAVLQSAQYSLALTRTVDTFILEGAPTPPEQATRTPTPIAGEGEILCYPQPAKDQLCFAYQVAAGRGAALNIKVYDLGAHMVAEVKDNAAGGRLEQTCVDISRLAPGVYFYRAAVGSFEFPLGQFGVAR